MLYGTNETSAHCDTYFSSSISQTNTWSRLQLTLDMLSMLCHARKVFPSFIDIVVGFGFKTTGTNEYFSVCNRRIQSAEIRSPAELGGYGILRKLHLRIKSDEEAEICYNVWFVEKHGRPNLSDPWSFRQTAAYQGYSFDRRASTWILIQSPNDVRKSLESNLSQPDFPMRGSPMTMHLRLLKYAARNWRWFLNYLSDLQREMVLIPRKRFNAPSGIRREAAAFKTDCSTLPEK